MKVLVLKSKNKLSLTEIEYMRKMYAEAVKNDRLIVIDHHWETEVIEFDAVEVRNNGNTE